MSVSERAGRIVNYLWALAAAVVFVLWLQDPGLFARESIAERIESWGSWMFTGFIGISPGARLPPWFRGTPVIHTGGMLFPELLPMVFAISIVGIVVSATVNLSLTGRGWIRRFSGTEVSGEDRPSEDASRKTLCLLGCGRVVLLSFRAD